MDIDGRYVLSRAARMTAIREWDARRRRGDQRPLTESYYAGPTPCGDRSHEADGAQARWGREQHERFRVGRYLQPPPLLFTSDHHPVWLGDLYRGQSAFLICGGPSFGELDHDLLRRPGVLTMALNNAVKTFRSNLWVSVDDPSHFIRSIWMDPTIQKFAPICHTNKSIFDSDAWRTMPHRVLDCPNVLYYKRNEHFKPEQFLWEDTLNWGNHKRLGGGRSVMLPALRILFFLGIRKVYLLGCDFQMAADYTYHFDQTRAAGSVSGNTSTYRKLSEWFARLRPLFEAEGFHVYNCNRDSCLTVFDHVGYESAIDRVADEFGRIDVEMENTSGLYDRQRRCSSPPKRTPDPPIREPVSARAYIRKNAWKHLGRSLIDACAQHNVDLTYGGDRSGWETEALRGENLILWGAKKPPDWYAKRDRSNFLFMENALIRQNSGVWIDSNGLFAASAIRSDRLLQSSPIEDLDARLAELAERYFGWSLYGGGNPDGPILLALQRENDAPCKYHFPAADNGRMATAIRLTALHAPDRQVLVRPHPKGMAVWRKHERHFRSLFREGWSVDLRPHIYETLQHCSALVTVNSTLATEALLLGVPVAVLGYSAFTGSGAVLECTENPGAMSGILEWWPDNAAVKSYLNRVLQCSVSYSTSASELQANLEFQRWIGRCRPVSAPPMHLAGIEADAILTNTAVLSKRLRREERGIVLSSDRHAQWLLPWWWERFRQHNDYPVAICDLGMDDKFRRWVESVGWRVFAIERLHAKAKAWHHSPRVREATPFDLTVWFDNDCEVRGSIDPVFEYAKNGFACTADPYNTLNEGRDPRRIACGVIGYRWDDPVVSGWAALMERDWHRYVSDQDALYTIYRLGDPGVVQMPQEYQALPKDPADVRQAAVVYHWCGKAKKSIQGAVNELLTRV